MESYLTAEISASAVAQNLRLLRERIGAGTKLCAVVKADCYGHGLRELLGLLAEHADVLGVATPEEALLLRQAGYERPIMMFFSACAYTHGPDLHEALEALIAARVTLTVVAPREVQFVSAAAERVGADAEVHVMIDTGMTRSGVPAGQAPQLIAAARAAPHVKLTGLYTHLAAADEADKTSARGQLAAFDRAVEQSGGRAGLTLHAANSAAAIDLPESHLDMVRPGIAIYGYQPSDEMNTRLPLRPCLRLTGRLMQIKPVPAGSRCGYGLTYEFPRDGRVALAPVGYGDGYLRCLSNRSTVRVRGADVPVRGRVSMDQLILDVTDCPAAEVGDEVEIFSPNPADPHSVENLARLAGTVPYEVTCRLGGRVRRILVD